METIQKTLQIGSQRIIYTVRISDRARRYRIAVSPQGVELVLPRGVLLFRADGLMRAHADWLEKQLIRMEDYQKRAAKRKTRQIALPENTILFKGIPCQLEINQVVSLRKQVRIEQRDGRIRIDAPAGKNIDLEPYLQAYLKQYAARLIPGRVHAWSQAMKLFPKRISIRSQRTRWGSCSSRGTLSFNWRLVMATPEVLDYVVIHEISHLAAPNHSPRFWELVQTFSPDYKQHRRWLRDQQALLYSTLITAK